MVHFLVRPSLVSSLMLAILLLVASSNATKVVDVNVICKQAQNPSFCLSILNSKPGGAAGADLVTLAQYTIDVARANITNTINLIKSLIASTTDPKAKSHYKTCLTHFGYNEGALGDLEYTEDRLKLGDYQGVNVAAGSVYSDADDCVSGDSPSDPPYDDPSSLPKYADFVEKVADVIMVISKYLMQN